MPGDFFFNLKGMGIKKVFKQNYSNEASRRSYYDFHNDVIMQGFDNNGFIFAHEIAHGIDEKFLGQLRKDPEFLEIYNHEIVKLEEAFSSAINDNFIQ